MDALNTMRATWTQIAPPIKENEVKGRWYAAIYSTPGNRSRNSLIIGRFESRFSFDERGPVQYIRPDCWKPKLEHSNILQPAPPHKRDVRDFPPHMVIAGPLKVYPVKGINWEIPS